VTGHSYDLVIVGAGSGNMLPTTELANWRIAVVESDRFGGTCLNRGCIPSKMFVHTADVAQTVRHATRFGIGAKWAGADWAAIRGAGVGQVPPGRGGGGGLPPLSRCRRIPGRGTLRGTEAAKGWRGRTPRRAFRAGRGLAPAYPADRWPCRGSLRYLGHGDE